MCGSMVAIQSAAAEIRRGKEKKEGRTNHSMKIYMVSLLHRAAITRMSTNANVMAAMPNIGGALCSTPQSLADAHYQSGVQ